MRGHPDGEACHCPQRSNVEWTDNDGKTRKGPCKSGTVSAGKCVCEADPSLPLSYQLLLAVNVIVIVLCAVLLHRSFRGAPSSPGDGAKQTDD